MTAYQVTYYLNLDTRNKSFERTDEQPVTRVATMTAHTVTGPFSAAEAAFVYFQVVDTRHPDLWEHRAPSMSVGDLVHVRGGGRDEWLVVSSTGFIPVAAPTREIPRDGRTVATVLREHRERAGRSA